MIKITISTENAAFDDDSSTEVARILRKLANELESHGAGLLPRSLFDYNGNRVGEATEE